MSQQLVMAIFPMEMEMETGMGMGIIQVIMAVTVCQASNNNNITRAPHRSDQGQEWGLGLEMDGTGGGGLDRNS